MTRQHCEICDKILSKKQLEWEDEQEDCLCDIWHMIKKLKQEIRDLKGKSEEKAK